jgi:hypothetical protein
MLNNKNKAFSIFYFIFGLILFLPSISYAQCTDPVRPEGAFGYNTTHNVMQYCDGTTWYAYHKVPVGCGVPTLCPNVGDVCDDSDAGTTNDPIFAGFLTYNNSETCESIFVTDSAQSTASQWKTSEGVDDIATDSEEDGEVNDGQVANSATFPAFKLCKDLTDGGFTDWYLPALTELNLLRRNQGAIGNFATAKHWSSTEIRTGIAETNAVARHFGNSFANQWDDGKMSTYDVRCIRRTVNTGGGPGILCPTPSLCPNVGDICDDSNPGTTNDPLFAGFLIYTNSTCEPLYVSTNRQSGSSVWNIATGTDDIATDSTEDGKINDGQIANSATWPGFKLCKDLTEGGFTDWYLPARKEFDTLWRNATEIDANAVTTIGPGRHWTSSETSTTQAYTQRATGGIQEQITKTSLNDIRCIRRD